MSEPTPTGPERLAGVGEGVQSLIRTLRVLFFGLRIVIIVVFVWLLFSGVFYVNEQDAVMLFHFGQLQSRVIDREQGPTDVLTSGRWYWAWPYPVDRKKRIPAQRTMTVTSGEIFWPRINPNDIEGRALQAQKALVPGTDGYLLTGDTNILHASWSVMYRIRDAKQYYLSFYDDTDNPKAARADAKPPKRGVEVLLQNLLANVVLAETATWKVDDAVVSSRDVPGESSEATPARESLAERVEARLRNLVEELGVGIEIQQVSLAEIQPPYATLKAFTEVADASLTQRRLKEEAESYRNRVVPEATGDAYRILDEARAYKIRVAKSVQAKSEYFKSLLEEYKANPDTMLVALYSDAIRDVLRSVDNKYIIHAPTGGAGQEIRLLLGPEPERPKAAGGDNAEEPR